MSALRLAYLNINFAYSLKVLVSAHLTASAYNLGLLIGNSANNFLLSLRFRDQIRDKLGSQKRKNNSNCKN